MASRVIYLDIDDEITSAASRIREVEASRVAVVLPHGSRVATSRINFRLLSRDALMHEKRLSIIAADPATRALAASAGLPVFATVAEYESSLGTEDGGATLPAPTVAATTAQPAEPVADLPGSERPAASASDEAVAAAAAAAAAVASAAALAGQTVRTDVPRPPAPAPVPAPALPPEPGPRPEPGFGRGGAATITTGRARDGGGPSRVPILIGMAILGLAVLVAGVGAYLILPSATIAVTPQPKRIGPIELTVTADPAATGPDIEGRVVPAERVTVDVSAGDTFPATGKRVVETKATGTVRFENLDFLNKNTIPAGSIVGTNGGVRFKTIGQVTVPKADIVGFQVFPGRIAVNVTAAKAGTEGNVDPNTIVLVPGGEDPVALKVTNPAATSGGTHEEFPQVSQEDVDAAMAGLGTSLEAAFQAKLADPSIVPAGTAIFPGTGVLGEATPSVDPATLVGQEVESFDLTLSATGTVIAADPDAVRQVAEAQLRASVDPGYELVQGSVEVKVGTGVVIGQTVRFPVSATALEIAVLDPNALKTMVLGKPVEEAKAILAPYGIVSISVWPDWVGSIPTFESRVDLSVDEAVTVVQPSPSPSGTTP